MAAEAGLAKGGERLAAFVGGGVEQRYGLAQRGVRRGGDEQLTGRAGQFALQGFGLQLQSAAANGVVAAAVQCEGAVGVHLGQVVGHQGAVVPGGGVDGEAALGIGAHAHPRQRCVGVAGLLTVEAAQRDVRERLRHAVGAEDGVGEGAHRLLDGGWQGAATNDEAQRAAQQRALVGHAQRFGHLGWREGGKVGRLVQSGIRVERRRAQQRLQSARHSAHQHHLPCYKLQRQAQQRRVALL